MSDASAVGDRTPRADLLAALASVVVVAVAVFAPVDGLEPLAAAVGLPFVLVVPGYALVAAAFPRTGEATVGQSRGASWTARLVLSVVGSVVAVAVVGVALDFTVWGFQRTAVVAGLCLFTVALTAVAWYRRRRLSAAVVAGTSADAVRARARAVLAGDGRLDMVLTLVVLVVAVAAGGVVANESTETGSVTEFYVLGETDSRQLVAGAYPSNLTAGEPVRIGVGVGTTDRSGFDGRVVTSLERLRIEEESVRVTESQRLDAFEVAIEPGETSVSRRTVQPSMVGDGLRLTYRLYEAGADRPLRRVQLRVTVRPA